MGQSLAADACQNLLWSHMIRLPYSAEGYGTSLSSRRVVAVADGVGLSASSSAGARSAPSSGSSPPSPPSSPPAGLRSSGAFPKISWKASSSSWFSSNSGSSPPSSPSSGGPPSEGGPPPLLTIPRRVRRSFIACSADGSCIGGGTGGRSSTSQSSTSGGSSVPGTVPAGTVSMLPRALGCSDLIRASARAR